MREKLTIDIQVLYISYDGMTDPLGQSQVLPYLCGLSAKGYKITLLSCEKPQRYEKYKKDIEAICSKGCINWQPIAYTSRPPVLSTIKDVRELTKTAFALHREYRFKIVHCRSYISALIGLRMKEKFAIRFLFDMRGFWADERVDGGLWNLTNPVYKTIYQFFKKKEKLYLEQADYTISLTKMGSDTIHTWKKIHNQPVPIQIIPCCVDTALFDPANIKQEQKIEMKNELGIASAALVMGYIGSIGTWYMLAEMLQCFKVFKEKSPDAIMLFITTEPEEMVRGKAKQLGIDDTAIVIRSATRTEVPLFISVMDYSIFFIKPCFSKKASSPTKQGEIMAMGIPVLCNSGVGDTDFVTNKYHSGISISTFNEATYSTAIDALTTTKYSAADIRKGAIDFYGLNKGVNSYASVYEKLLEK
jgi:glycosyltransferase involved in cell wall biosynthesis